eukprot:8577622-Karenia_brevis.AAC.1
MFIVSGARPINGYGILNFKDNPCSQLRPAQLVRAQKMRLCRHCWAGKCRTSVGERLCRNDCG